MAGEEIEVHGSGRTDAGSDARGQVANFHINAEICPDGESAREYLNRYLPDDIRVLSAKIVPERFHSRLSATSKTYGYYVETGDKKNVFERKYVYGCGKKLDVKAMRQAAEFLIGEHDFKSFCANRRMKKARCAGSMRSGSWNMERSSNSCIQETAFSITWCGS